MLRKISTWVTSTLVSLLLIFATLSVFGLVHFRAVLSESMVPVINKGDVVVGLSWVKPNLGDIAIYEQRDQTGKLRQDVVHRVISVAPDGELTFKGDNNQSQDAFPVKRAEVKSTVVAAIPSVGTLLMNIGLAPMLLISLGIALISFGVFKLLR